MPRFSREGGLVFMGERHRASHSDVVSASEIASWVYCPEQWRLQYGLGHKSENVASLDRGERFHKSTAVVERSSRRILRLAVILIVVAALLLVVVLLVRR
jgi:PD-(D/E)XK nuclease superfamily